MIYYFESKNHNPYFNIASEYTILKNIDGTCLYLWTNQPCVIAGVNQDTTAEWNIEILDKKKILPVRRLTGGGCVYQDLGNLNFTFTSPKKDFNFLKFFNIIIDSLKYFNIHAYQSGRNDILVSGKKVCGTAYLEEDDKILFHGTLMVCVNIDQLVEVLTPSHKKFEGKGISSIKARVKNLTDFNSNINITKLKKVIKENFEKTFNSLSETDTPIPVDKNLYFKLISSDWIYYGNTENKILIEEKINNENIDIYLTIKNDIILDSDIFTDSLDYDIVKRLKSFLIGKKYSQFYNYIKEFK